MHIIHSTENLHESTKEECPVNIGQIRAIPNSQVLPFTTSDSITIDISGNVPTTQRNFVYISWYLNGGSLPSGTSVSSLLKLPTGISQTLRINNPTPLHNGTYEVVLRLDYRRYYLELGCPDYYAGLYPSILDQITINLDYYGELILVSLSSVAVYTKFYRPYPSIEPATISIQSSRPALQDNEYTTLNCSADGGYPPISSISWVKNGRVISTTSDEELVITVAANDSSPFGRYKCVVNNSVTIMETSILMKQRGDYCS